MDKDSEGRCSSCCGCTEPVGWQGWWSQLEGKWERGMAGHSGGRGRARALSTLMTTCSRDLEFGQ